MMELMYMGVGGLLIVVFLFLNYSKAMGGKVKVVIQDKDLHDYEYFVRPRKTGGKFLASINETDYILEDSVRTKVPIGAVKKLWIPKYFFFEGDPRPRAESKIMYHREVMKEFFLAPKVPDRDDEGKPIGVPGLELAETQAVSLLEHFQGNHNFEDVSAISATALNSLVHDSSEVKLFASYSDWQIKTVGLIAIGMTGLVIVGLVGVFITGQSQSAEVVTALDAIQSVLPTPIPTPEATLVPATIGS